MSIGLVPEGVGKRDVSATNKPLTSKDSPVGEMGPRREGGRGGGS